MVARPQLSIRIPNFAESPDGWSTMFDTAVAADRAGVDRLVVSEHVVFGERADAYSDPSVGGIAGGTQPTSPDGHWLDPLTVLSMVAAQTTRIRLGTEVLLAALRPAPLLAKQVATLDVLSGGRLDLGVGVGWQREEYESCGVDFHSRGELLERCLDICQQLWTLKVVDVDDGTLRLDRIHAMPKPSQPNGVPIWISGRCTPRLVRRIVRFGSGWIPWGDDMADPVTGIREIRRGLEASGRDPSELKVQGRLPVVRDGNLVNVEATVEGVPTLVEGGVTDFRFDHRWGTDTAAEEVLLQESVDAFRGVVGSPSSRSEPT